MLNIRKKIYPLLFNATKGKNKPKKRIQTGLFQLC